MKRILLALAILLIYNVTFSQIQSPAEFLGYELGTKFTPHYKIVSYAKYIADHSKMVAYKKYGVTNEGRDLITVFVGTEENIKQLETIRNNNLDVANRKAGFSANQPTLVWLSYNVHGNEPTSSEAALQTLYDLVNPTNIQTKDWLKNTVVIIDPCMNPDGRDRYVNWYNSVVGKNYNVNPVTREHMEPWPRGRSNHYNFDLNRDWAWQTQLESQQRMALYNSWLPQVHVDFHEQGYNEPYFFAPAAEPMHDVLTQWQKDFQTLIGKNHSKYFDKEGWLFFTKERFDLFYPSYGDTYPLYNGAIGMTYEQGGINAGLGVITKDGDTLTFVERVKHHITTGLSTIEVASKNASRLLSEFKKYFDDSYSGKMDVNKSYVIKYSAENAQRINDLVDLLQKNKIEFGNPAQKISAKGYNYFTKKEENFSTDEKDIIINTQQSKASLIRVMFEPESHLTDSVTYDITAWAIPYVYGIPSYASKLNINTKNYQKPKVETNITSDDYGYVFEWGGMESAKMAAALLKKGYRLKVTQNAFTANGKKYSAGSVLVLKTNNSKLQKFIYNDVIAFAKTFNIEVGSLNSGMVDTGNDFGSDAVKTIEAPGVVLVSGSSVGSLAFGEVWSYFDNVINYPLSIVNADDINRINWSKTDVIILADGSYGFLFNKQFDTQLQNWIRGGGKLIAMENSLSQLAQLDWIKLKPVSFDADSSENAKIEKSNYANREREFVSSTTPGAIFKVSVDNTHPLMYGFPDYYFTLKENPIVFKSITGDGWNVGVIKENKQIAGFVGEKLSKQLKNGVVLAVQDFGNGHIISIADDVLFRNFWNNGMLIFSNAVFMVQ